MWGLSGEDIDHFLIVGLVSPTTVHTNLAMLVDGRDWYLLDSHLISVA